MSWERHTVVTTVMLIAAAIIGLHTDIAHGQVPDGWLAAGSDPQDYDMGVDPAMAYGGKASGYIKSKVADPKGFGTLMQMFRPDDYRGRPKNCDRAASAD